VTGDPHGPGLLPGRGDRAVRGEVDVDTFAVAARLVLSDSGGDQEPPATRTLALSTLPSPHTATASPLLDRARSGFCFGVELSCTTVGPSALVGAVPVQSRPATIGSSTSQIFLRIGITIPLLCVTGSADPDGR
jgi:hypothetical protein